MNEKASVEHYQDILKGAEQALIGSSRLLSINRALETELVAQRELDKELEGFKTEEKCPFETSPFEELNEVAVGLVAKWKEAEQKLLASTIENQWLKAAQARQESVKEVGNQVMRAEGLSSDLTLLSPPCDHHSTIELLSQKCASLQRLNDHLIDFSARRARQLATLARPRPAALTTMLTKRDVPQSTLEIAALLEDQEKMINMLREAREADEGLMGRAQRVCFELSGKLRDERVKNAELMMKLKEKVEGLKDEKLRGNQIEPSFPSAESLSQAASQWAQAFESGISEIKATISSRRNLRPKPFNPTSQLLDFLRSRVSAERTFASRLYRLSSQNLSLRTRIRQLESGKSSHLTLAALEGVRAELEAEKTALAQLAERGKECYQRIEAEVSKHQKRLKKVEEAAEKAALGGGAAMKKMESRLKAEVAAGVRAKKRLRAAEMAAVMAEVVKGNLEGLALEFEVRAEKEGEKASLIEKKRIEEERKATERVEGLQEVIAQQKEKEKEWERERVELIEKQREHKEREEKEKEQLDTQREDILIDGECQTQEIVSLTRNQADSLSLFLGGLNEEVREQLSDPEQLLEFLAKKTDRLLRFLPLLEEHDIEPNIPDSKPSRPQTIVLPSVAEADRNVTSIDETLQLKAFGVIKGDEQGGRREGIEGRVSSDIIGTIPEMLEGAAEIVEANPEVEEKLYEVKKEEPEIKEDVHEVRDVASEIEKETSQVEDKISEVNQVTSDVEEKEIEVKEVIPEIPNAHSVQSSPEIIETNPVQTPPEIKETTPEIKQATPVQSSLSQTPRINPDALLESSAKPRPSSLTESPVQNYQAGFLRNLNDSSFNPNLPSKPDYHAPFLRNLNESLPPNQDTYSKTSKLPMSFPSISEKHESDNNLPSMTEVPIHKPLYPPKALVVEEFFSKTDKPKSTSDLPKEGMIVEKEKEPESDKKCNQLEQIEEEPEHIDHKHEHVEHKDEHVEDIPEKANPDSRPAEQKPEPIEQKPEPIEQKPEPIEQKPEPIEQKPEPVEQRPEHVEQTPEHVEQRPEPVEQRPEPVEQRPEPVEQKPERTEKKVEVEHRIEIEEEEISVGEDNPLATSLFNEGSRVSEPRPPAMEIEEDLDDLDFGDIVTPIKGPLSSRGFEDPQPTQRREENPSSENRDIPVNKNISNL